MRFQCVIRSLLFICIFFFFKFGVTRAWKEYHIDTFFHLNSLFFVLTQLIFSSPWLYIFLPAFSVTWNIALYTFLGLLSLKCVKTGHLFVALSVWGCEGKPTPLLLDSICRQTDLISTTKEAAQGRGKKCCKKSAAALNGLIRQGKKYRTTNRKWKWRERKIRQIW